MDATIVQNATIDDEVKVKIELKLQLIKLMEMIGRFNAGTLSNEELQAWQEKEREESARISAEKGSQHEELIQKKFHEWKVNSRIEDVKNIHTGLDLTNFCLNPSGASQAAEQEQPTQQERPSTSAEQLIQMEWDYGAGDSQEKVISIEQISESAEAEFIPRPIKFTSPRALVEPLDLSGLKIVQSDENFDGTEEMEEQHEEYPQMIEAPIPEPQFDEQNITEAPIVDLTIEPPAELVEEVQKIEPKEEKLDKWAKAMLCAPDQPIGKTRLLATWEKVWQNKHSGTFEKFLSEKIPGYTRAVKQPFDLRKIKANIQNGKIATYGQLEKALSLMFANTMIFNDSVGSYAVAAREMAKHAFQCLKDDRREPLAMSEELKQKRRASAGRKQRYSPSKY